jgi:hypothetical protein
MVSDVLYLLDSIVFWVVFRRSARNQRAICLSKWVSGRWSPKTAAASLPSLVGPV